MAVSSEFPTPDRPSRPATGVRVAVRKEPTVQTAVLQVDPEARHRRDSVTIMLFMKLVADETLSAERREQCRVVLEALRRVFRKNCLQGFYGDRARRFAGLTKIEHVGPIELDHPPRCRP